jgi:2-isopropylmalate synthase
VKLLRPPRLNPGDTLGIIAPASAPPDPKNVDRAIAVLEKLGYKMGEKELGAVFTSFKELADKKKEVFDDDLIALIERERGEKMQKTYELVFLSVLTESKKGPKVAIRIKSKGKMLSATGTGSGPVDAAYKIIDKLIKHNAKLLDYQIKSVTVGKDAQGEVTVKVEESPGEVVIGQSADTDVMEASVRAYLDAMNKIANKRANHAKLKGKVSHGV